MADDYSGDTSTTGVVQFHLPKTGSIETGGDHDWFRVYLYGGQDYIIDLYGGQEAGTLGIPQLSFHDFAGTQLSSGTPFGNGYDQELGIHVTTSGVYFIDVFGFAPAVTGTYLLTLDHAADTRFQPITGEPDLPLFGSASDAGGWTDNNLYPRELTQAVTRTQFSNVTFNHDLENDIVGFGENGVYVSQATGNGQFAAPQLMLLQFGRSGAGGWTSQDQYPREVADIDNNGYTDIVGFGANGVYVSLNFAGVLGSIQFVLPQFGTAQGWSSQDHYPRVIGDVNGDGRNDIVAFGEAGTYVALSNGTGFGPANLVLANFGAIQGWTTQDTYTRALADVNGDGKADIIAFGMAGTYVSLATGGGNFANPALVLANFGTNQGWTSQDQHPRELADMNNDNLADIVGFGANGVYVALNNHSGGFSAPVADLGQFGSAQGWGSQNQTPRLLGDITGDGIADIVAFDAHGVHTSVSLDYLLV